MKNNRSKVKMNKNDISSLVKTEINLNLKQNDDTLSLIKNVKKVKRKISKSPNLGKKKFKKQKLIEATKNNKSILNYFK